MDVIRRKCPWCGGLFYLDQGVALCPHCRKPVKADGQKNESLRLAFIGALADKAAFWQGEIAELMTSFPEAAERLRREFVDRR
jgi:hypothetical protein